MGQKVTFNPVTKIIQVDIVPTGGEIRLDIQVDIYSDGKEDWRAESELFKRRFPVRVVGGDPRPGDDPLGSSYFLDSSWKIRPYEADHLFIVTGNFYAEDGTSPFVKTVGNYNVFMSRETSNIVDKVATGSGLSIEQDASLTEVHQAHYNKRLWNGADTLTVYDTDKITPLHVFDTDTDLHEITPQ